MWTAWISIVVMTLVGAPADALTVEFKAKYYADTTLTCDAASLQLPYTTFKIYWALPDGSFLNWFYTGDEKYTVGEGPEFNLTINNIDDRDFGWYYCVILWDNYIYLTHSIKVGLNVNGADYEDMYDGYRNSALIGGIMAAGTAFLLALCCLVYWCRYSEVNMVNKPKKLKAPTSRSSSKSGSSDSSKGTVSAEQEAIYVLDKAVKGFEGPYSLPSIDSSNVGHPAAGFDLRRLSSFKGNNSPNLSQGDDSEYTLPPPPPPPPLMTSSMTEQLLAQVIDTYDHVTRGVRTSTVTTTDGDIECHADIYAVPSESNDHPTYMNPEVDGHGGFKEASACDQDELMETNDKAEIGAVDIVDSSEFQEQINDQIL